MPHRAPGPQLNQRLLRNKSTALDFFSLYFDEEVIQKIAKHANEYGNSTIHQKNSYADKNGDWTDTTPEEVRKLIAILLYHGLVRVNTFRRYWSTKSLYHWLMVTCDV